MSRYPELDRPMTRAQLEAWFHAHTPPDPPHSGKPATSMREWVERFARIPHELLGPKRKADREKWLRAEFGPDGYNPRPT